MLGVIGFAAIVAAVVVMSGRGDDEPATTGPATTGAPATAVVPVAVTGIEGAVGYDLAGVLCRGAESINPDEHVVGGFGATVDTDPFATTQQVRQPLTDRVEPFPFVSEEPLRVEPGTFTVVLWLAPSLEPYSRWAPSDVTDPAVCKTTFEVGQDALTVEIDGHSIEPIAPGGGLNSCATR